MCFAIVCFSGSDIINVEVNLITQSPSLEVKAGFLEISKDFHKVWYEGLIKNLKLLEFQMNCSNFFNVFVLCHRLWRVVLNHQSSAWSRILTGVSQGSILGPLLFLTCQVQQMVHAA